MTSEKKQPVEGSAFGALGGTSLAPLRHPCAHAYLCAAARTVGGESGAPAKVGTALCRLWGEKRAMWLEMTAIPVSDATDVFGPQKLRLM